FPEKYVDFTTAVEGALDRGASARGRTVPERHQHVALVDQALVARHRHRLVASFLEGGAQDLDGEPLPAGGAGGSGVHAAGTAGHDASVAGQVLDVRLDPGEVGEVPAADDPEPHLLEVGVPPVED